jgi:lipopolysaccharide transport system ATP-binding protein
MSDVIIRVEELGKRYSLRRQADQPYVALREIIAGMAKNLWRQNGGTPNSQPPPPPSCEPFWALRDVSFEVKQGDVLGIIGRNGAGKSTLLKILSRITEPTEGRVRIKGRVASLLEVGTGFHPELSGRENIFLNGAVLGMTRAEIKKKFDEIVAFAETEKFLDTPVKRYSSGMYVRLAFAVAAHLQPEILVIDEVLAVGDAAFQKKCLGKMREVSSGGRTVLFVSHNMGAISSLCDQALVLAEGRLAFQGRPDAAIATYLESRAQMPTLQENKMLSRTLMLSRLDCSPPTITQYSGLKLVLELKAEAPEVISDLIFEIYAVNGGRVAVIDLRSVEGPYRLQPGQVLIIESEITKIPLVEGHFDVGIYLNADSVYGVFSRLSSFAVLPAACNNGVVPREPRHRGAVELRPRVTQRIVQLTPQCDY